MKKTLIPILFALFVGTAYSQDISLKDGNILYNDTAILKYKKLGAMEFSIFTLADDEIIYSVWRNNETPKNYDDDYIVINFFAEKIKGESTKDELAVAGFGLNPKKNLLRLTNWLLKEKVLNTDGSINKAKLEIFYEKYNENISQRTIRRS